MDLNVFLQVLTSVFTIALLIVGIVLGIRLIQVINKAEQVIDDVSEKIESLNGIFSIIDKASLGLNLVGSRIIDSITELIKKIVKRKKEDIDYE